MNFTVRQTRRFARQYKKLHDNNAVDVDAAVAVVAADPAVGQRKRGGLADGIACVQVSKPRTIVLAWLHRRRQTAAGVPRSDRPEREFLSGSEAVSLLHDQGNTDQGPFAL